MVAVETRAADNTEEDEEEVEEEEEKEEGRGLRVVQEAMSKLFAYAEGGGGTRSNVEWGRVRRGRRRRWNDDGGGRESATMVAMVTPR